MQHKEFEGRYIQLSVKFDSCNSQGKLIRGKSLTIALISAYFPCDDIQHEQFYSAFDSMLNSINSNTMIIIGSDINARIGIIRTCDKHTNVIGPHGIERSNARGKNLLHILGAHRMHVEDTFFQHKQALLQHSHLHSSPRNPKYARHLHVLPITAQTGEGLQHDTRRSQQRSPSGVHDTESCLHQSATQTCPLQRHHQLAENPI